LKSWRASLPLLVPGSITRFRSEGWEDENIASRLGAAGYRTTIIGKYMNGCSEGPEYTNDPTEGYRGTVEMVLWIAGASAGGFYRIQAGLLKLGQGQGSGTSYLP
jgi:hypothetical protein